MKNIEVFLKKKEKKRQYGNERYKNLSEDEKQIPVEYRKKYINKNKNKKYNASPIKTE